MVSRKFRIDSIPIAKSFFDAEEERLTRRVIRSGWVAQGRMVEEFEKRVARYTGAEYAVAVSSGTAALHLALLAAGIGPGDEVVVPSFSFIATANAVLHSGARPIFADIDPATYNIDAGGVEAAVKKSRGRTKAVMPVHQFGLACDIDAIAAVARRHGLILIEDAACALGSTYKTGKVGERSKLAAFSFHPRKILTTGEGGMVVTNNRSYAEKIRMLRNHGGPAEPYAMLGYNYRLTDLQAAIGVAQMKRLGMVLRRRRELAARYDMALRDIGLLRRPFVPPYAGHNYQSYVVRVRAGGPVSRDAALSVLFKHGISARRGNTAIHLQPLYKKYGARLPHTEKAASDTIALPLYFNMKSDEQDFVIEKLRSIFRSPL